MNNNESISAANLKYGPVLMSLLGGNHPGMLTDTEKQNAANLAKVKSYGEIEELQPFFQEVYKTFEHDLAELNKTLPAGKIERKKAIINKLSLVKESLHQMPLSKQRQYKKAFVAFARLTSKGERNIIEDNFAAIVEVFLRSKKDKFRKILN